MNYPDSVQFLYSLGNEVKTAKFGLERITTLLDALGNPAAAAASCMWPAPTAKGSTCAMIESGLRAAGLRTGLFTSPHLAEPTERIRIDGCPVSCRCSSARAFDRVHAVRRSSFWTGARSTFTPPISKPSPPWRFCLFHEQRDRNGGAGSRAGRPAGRDQCGHPELCVITPVDFDHEAFLGKSLEAIAGEKAGILKPGVPAVFAGQRPEAQAYARRARSRIGHRSGPCAREVESGECTLDRSAAAEFHRAEAEMIAPLRIALPSGWPPSGGECHRRNRSPR